MTLGIFLVAHNTKFVVPPPEEPEPPPADEGITLDTAVQTFTAETPDFFGFDDRRFNPPIEPGMVYEGDGVTMMTVNRPWNSTYLAYAGLWKYSALYGAYPAFIDIGEAQAADNHLTGSLFKDATHYNVFQENTHKGNLDWFKIPHDLSSSIKQTTKTGTFSRMGVRRLGESTAFLLHQNGETNVAKTPFDGATIGTPVEILTHATKRIYALVPFGPETDVNGWYFIPLAVTEGTPGSRFIAKLLIKTQDFVTFYNIDESQSFDITGGSFDIHTLDDLADKWTYIGDLNTASLDNLTFAITCIDSAGNFLDVTVIPGSNQISTTTFQGGAWVTNTYSPGTIADFASSGLADSNSCIGAVFKKNNTVYSLIRVEDGAFYKFHLFSTINNGVSWTDLGDITPGVNVNIYRANVPLNVHEIPDDENFPITSTEYTYVGGPGQFADIYLLKAAWGALQNYQTFTYTTKYNAITEFPSLHVAYESDDVTISGGTTISLLNDKVGARDAVAIGSPQLTAGEIVCNGTSSAFQLNNYVAEFNAHTKATICFVGRLPGYVLCITKTTDDNQFSYARLLSTKFISAWRDNSLGNTLSCSGVGADISSAEHIYVFQIDGRSVRCWIDGIEQNKTFMIAGTGFNNYGKWGGLVTPNRVGIGILQRSTNSFTALNFKALSYAPVAYTTEERMQAENFLADKYGITITR